MAPESLPRLAVLKLASCDGCQLGLLDCEDELLAVAQRVEIAHFLEASSRITPGPYDLTLVEGSVTTERDRQRLLAIRAESRALVTIGACATAGGVQALRNFADHPDMVRSVYPRPEWIASLATSTPVSAHVAVDFELRGCPIDRHQLLEVITAFLHGRKPTVAAHAACIDCKMRGIPCVMVARGEPCLGPITHAGCGALCPSVGRGCYGCFGPSDAAQTRPLARRLLAGGTPRPALRRLFTTFNAAAPAFREGLEELDDDQDDPRRPPGPRRG
jgi:sulfhydrogenase subunit delta